MFNAFSRSSALETAGHRYANGRSVLLPALPKSVSLIPIKTQSQDSSNATFQDKKRMASVLCSSNQPFSTTTKMNKTPILNTENNIMSMLKKLPDITCILIPPKSVFKVPEIPNCHTKITIPDNQSKIVSEKKFFSENTENNILSTSVIVAEKFENIKNINSNPKTNPTQKQKPKKRNSNVLLVHNNARKRILKTTSNINLFSEKNNGQRTSSPKAELPSFSQIKLKKLKTEKKVPYNPIISNEVKNNFDNGLNTNGPMNYEAMKTIKHNSDNYSFMNTPTKQTIEKEINSISATFPMDLNVTIPGYDGFLQGIGTSSEYISHNMQFDNSQSNVEKESFTGQDIKTALNVNIYQDVHFNSAPQSHSAEENSNDDLLEKIQEGDSVDCIKSLEAILSNDLQNFPSTNFDEYINGAKRKQTNNEPCKKQKTGDENLSNEIFITNQSIN